MQVGDLITHNPTGAVGIIVEERTGSVCVAWCSDPGYVEPAIIVEKYGGRYLLAFPDGTTQVFHPNHIKPDKK